jgi:NAD(P)-dependent dehydrogenase (short-subunit alcohol dehydrogenase family)
MTSLKILIVGADSGIGQALYCKLRGDHSVTGTSRRPTTEHIFLQLEDQTTWKLPEQYDQVYYCLGIAAKNHTSSEVYNTNALLAVEFLDHLAGFVKPGGIVRIMSSITGSITSVLDNPMPAVHLHYKMSKAALNMGVATLHHKHKNVTWQLIHPGLVKTKMTAGVLDHVPGAIDPDTCADYLTALPHQHQTQLQFLNYDGSILGW